MKNKVIILVVLVLAAVLSITMFLVLKKGTKESCFTPWVPMTKERKAAVADFHVNDQEVEQQGKNDGLALGLIDRQSIYFRAGHLSSGDGDLLEPDSVNVWAGSDTKKGDTVTISMPWGHVTLAVVDTIQYRYEDYYHYHEYYFIAHRIDTLDADYYNRMTNACVVMKGKRSPASEFDFQQCGLYSRDESDIIDRWVDAQLPALRDTFNDEARRSVIKDTLATDEKVRGSKKIFKLIAKEGDARFFVIAEWITEQPHKSLGLYTIGTKENGTYKPFWIERWIKPDGDIGYIADVVGLVVADTSGRVGALINRAFYEGRDVQLRVLSRDLKRVEEEIDILDY